MQTNKQNYLTLLLLCLGYFIDFYDLTIMGVSYNELIKEQFHILNQAQIQQTYLLISNFQTVGIFIGAVLFGWLGDKIGRAAAIKYSILLYSISTILAVYTTSLPIFIALRTLSYIGLAAEFSTSTVLILELFPVKSASWSSALLYSFGVLGGMTATFIGILSWKLMFILGGSAGLVLFIARARISESAEYLYAKTGALKAELGSFRQLLLNKSYLLGIGKYLLMILPFYAIITMMFIFPNYIVVKTSIASATKTLLIGFFIGNIISCFLSAIINNHYKNYKASMFVMLIIFLILMLNFNQIQEKYLLFYFMGLGLIGGGYPISWAQQIAREYPTHIRSLASNILFALGRASSIIFNILISSWLAPIDNFKHNAVFAIIITFILAISSLFFSKNVYKQ